MSFFRAVNSGFSGYLTITGRANRREFWFWFAFVVLVLCLALIIDGAFLGPIYSSFLGYEGVMAFDQDAGKPLTVVLMAILAMPTITIAIRRLHDSDLSGWWLLIGVTIIGLIPLAYFLIKGAKKGENRFTS